MLHETTAWREGDWATSTTWAGSWEHTETITLRELPGGSTAANLAGWWVRPGLAGASNDRWREALDHLARDYLATINQRAREGFRPRGDGSAQH